MQPPQTELHIIDAPLKLAFDHRSTLHNLQLLVRLLVISHQEIESVVGDALGHALNNLTDAQWQELGINKNRWRTVIMAILYLLREDGGQATRRRTRTHFDDPLMSDAPVGSARRDEKRMVFYRVSKNQDTIGFSGIIHAVLATKERRAFIPFLPQTPEWWDDRVACIVDNIFGWKDRVVHIISAFIAARFVIKSDPARDDDDDDAGLPTKHIKDMASTLKFAIKKVIVDSTLDSRLVAFDVDFELHDNLKMRVRALYDRASATARKCVPLDDLLSVARSTLEDALLIVRQQTPRMIKVHERSTCFQEHPLRDFAKGVPKPTHHLLPMLHALKTASGSTPGLGLNLGPEFILMSLRRTSILIYLGEDLAGLLLGWPKRTWIPWRSRVLGNPEENVSTVLLSQIESSVKSTPFVECLEGSWVPTQAWNARWEALRKHVLTQLEPEPPVSTDERRGPASPASGVLPHLGSPTDTSDNAPEASPSKRAKKQIKAVSKLESGCVARRFTHLGPLVIKVLFKVESLGAYFVPHGQWLSDGQSVKLLVIHVGKAVCNKRSLLPSQAASRQSGKHSSSSPKTRGVGSIPRGMPRLERVETFREKILRILFKQAQRQDWSGPGRIQTKLKGDKKLRETIEKGANDVIVIGIDPGTTCPLAVSATLFDRNEEQIQDDLVVYSAALDKPLKNVQAKIRTVSAHLAGELRFGHLNHKMATVPGDQDPVPGSATSTTSTADGDAASATARARFAADSSSRLLLGEPARQVWTAKAQLREKGLESRFVEQVMDLVGVRCIEKALDGSLKQADLSKVKSAETLRRVDIHRGTQNATYKTNAYCRELVKEIVRLQSKGIDIEAFKSTNSIRLPFATIILVETRLLNIGRALGAEYDSSRVLCCEKECWPPVHRDLVAARNIAAVGLHVAVFDEHPFRYAMPDNKKPEDQKA
ncbi:BQ2448_148 [Microbotryum intermedium]|uniref:BQ2448_148 protein n=1 Tax=Microbotryum intermedium TaxID=269621 RepID=A0A238F4Q3_9BASI|nr:BQ2448_148 [Microbotryum intermedium]